jgi:hypothetical protein
MNFVRSEKLNAMFAGAFVLTMSLGACAPAQDGELASEDTEDVDAESAQQALSATFTPSAFTMSGAYNGTSFFGGGCSAKQSLIGHEPSAAGKYPVAVWLTGTAADYAGEGALAFTRSMASLGFVSASVEYTNGTYPSCSTLTTRASCVFNKSSSSSAIAKLCARPKADCSKGIVVAGISQGANIASLAKNYDSRARAAYLLSNVVTPSFYDNTSCLKNSATTFAPNQVRTVSAEADEFMSGISETRSNLVTASGFSCSGNNCLQSDGSGWYIVTNGEVSDGKADHCYLLNGGCSSDAIDPRYETSTAAWSGWTNLKWLAGRIYP